MSCWAVGCYDSSWGSAKRSQQSVAQARTPQALAPIPADSAGTTLARTKTIRVRAYATPRHVAEVSDWQGRLQDLLDDANRVVGPTWSARLELADARAWGTQVSDDALAPMLADLSSTDRADDVDVVIGLTGSVPRFEESFHELGMAELPGKHLVLRAMNEAREQEAIERGFTELDATERTKLFSARKRHKRATVLLHELGHLWGAPHEVSVKSIMTPRYATTVESYDAASVELVRLGLEESLKPISEREARSLAKAAIEVLQRTADSWIPAEREAAIRRLSAQADTGVTPTKPRTVSTAVSRAGSGPPPSNEALLASLAPPHRAAYDRALEWHAKGKEAEAWAEAAPLWDAYPSVAPVQDLRCQLAMKLRDWSQAKKECAAMLPTGKKQ